MEGNGPHLWWLFLPQLTYSRNFLKTHPDMCVYGDPKSHEVGNQDWASNKHKDWASWSLHLGIALGET